ncbi:hypothetical protein [Glutamicibacter sp. HZAU]|uniref:hypothetical protein n=1 Tax=Glutamicibacter sp. HZAU TaxID=2049891 RepID=UPI000FFB3669|nr:hypothetical protein [Glutamicibacter sp. HZAU]MDV2976412.1 hypothetical protein [Actinomycetes bacterium ARC8]RWZ84044.1 hypothetical protein EKH49_05435 [Glutamicibacter sp. HZAU]
MSQRAQRRVQKTAAVNSQPVVDGNTARVMRPEPVPASNLPKGDSRQRVTLSLVPKMNETNKRSMFTMSAVLIFLAFSVIVTLVLLNTSVAQRQYDIVNLRSQERALSQENQALLKEAQSLAAPQALAAKAKDLGLVSPGAPGLISLSEGKVTQDAEKAVKAKNSKQEYGTIPLPGDSIRKGESKTDANASNTPKTTVGKASADSQKESGATDGSKEPEVKAEKTEREIDKDGRPVFQDTELNGGTIPAPSIKSPAE